MNISCRQAHKLLGKLKDKKAEFDLALQEVDVEKFKRARELKKQITVLLAELREGIDSFLIEISIKSMRMLNELYRRRAEVMEKRTGQKGLSEVLQNTLEKPIISKEFSKEQMDVFTDFFGDSNLSVTMMPAPEKLTDEYFEVMYPYKKDDRDSKAGLMSFRPEWWDEILDNVSSSLHKWTWQHAFIKATKKQASQLKRSILLTETIQKPNLFVSERYYYGSQEGNDRDLDPLQPYIEELIGEGYTRFDLSANLVEHSLIPLLKDRLEDEFIKSGLELPDYDIIMTPAIIFNQFSTLINNSSTQTDGYEMSSTEYIDNDRNSRIFICGCAISGGASYIGELDRDESTDNCGFRLSIVLK